MHAYEYSDVVNLQLNPSSIARPLFTYMYFEFNLQIPRMRTSYSHCITETNEDPSAPSHPLPVPMIQLPMQLLLQ